MRAKTSLYIETDNLPSHGWKHVTKRGRGYGTNVVHVVIPTGLPDFVSS